MMIRKQVCCYTDFGDDAITGVIHDKQSRNFIWLLGDNKYVFMSSYSDSRGVTTALPVRVRDFHESLLIKHRIIEEDKPKMYRYRVTAHHDTNHPDIKLQKTSIVTATSCDNAGGMVRSKSATVERVEFLGEVD